MFFSSYFYKLEPAGCFNKAIIAVKELNMIARAKNENYDLPEAGNFQGVIFATYDGGMQPNKFKPNEERVHKMKFGIELNKLYIDGEFKGQRMTRYPEFTVSLGKKSNLRPVVVAFLGRDLTKEEEEGFELNNLIGWNCQVSILHRVSESTGNAYAVTRLSPILDGIPLIKPILKPDYLPEFIKEWQIKGQVSIVKEVKKEINQNISYEETSENYRLLEIFKKIDPELSKNFAIEYLRQTNENFSKLIISAMKTRLSNEYREGIIPKMPEIAKKYDPDAKNLNTLTAEQLMKVYYELYGLDYPKTEDEQFKETGFNPEPINPGKSVEPPEIKF